MAEATITSKGQVTIPKEVRERLGLRTGDRLDFKVEQEGWVRITPVSKSVDEVFGMLSSKSRRAIPVEEMDARLKKGLRRRNR